MTAADDDDDEGDGDVDVNPCDEAFFPDNPSESFLERMVEDNPLEGPSWLFASVKKKGNRSRGGRGHTAAKKLSAVMSEEEGGGGRGSSSLALGSSSNFDSSDIVTTTSESDVSGFVEMNNVLDPDLTDALKEKTNIDDGEDSGETILEGIDMEMTQESENHDETASSADEDSFDGEQEDVGDAKEDSFGGEREGGLLLVEATRTPLRELTVTNNSSVIKYNPKVPTGVTVDKIREAKIDLDNIGVRGRRYTWTNTGLIRSAFSF